MRDSMPSVSMRQPIALVVFVFGLFPMLQTVRSEGATIYVSKSGENTQGLSWGSAFHTINEALDIAKVGDEIWVKVDTYNESVQVTKEVAFIGGFRGDEASVEERSSSNGRSAIDSNGTSLPGIICNAGVTIQTFELVNGDHPGITMYLANNVRVQDCIIDHNGSPTSGGGIAITESSADISSCTVTGNVAAESGGGLLIRKSTVTLTDCLIAGNTAGRGAGILIADSVAMIRNCIITRNEARNGDLVGAGVLTGGDLTILENCLIYRNIVHRFDLGRGSQIYFPSFRDDVLEIRNCTIVGDENGIFWLDLPPSISNSIVVGSNNVFQPVYNNPLDATITNSCIQGGYPGEGNIDVDPMFVDLEDGDFHLKPESPCIDTASIVGPDDDLDGNPRPVDVPGTGRDGTDAYDMGAYEFQEGVLPPNADLDGDGKVDSKDLMLLQLQWQTGK